MAHSRGSELDPLVGEFHHLTSKPRSDEALHIIQRIASVVKPIMRVRNWRVGTLAEFYPQEANLLGLNTNRGEKIHLRLRYPGDHSQFMPFENVVDTMLHELCHIVHGPHNQAFNALWDKLRDEHEALVRKGYTGEGFLGHGSRLGGRRIPRSELQRQARAAAERRRQAADLARGSGTKLGGQGIFRGQDAREVIAAAAEKRNRIAAAAKKREQIDRGCGSTMAGDMAKKIEQEEATNHEKVAKTKAQQAEEDEAALMEAYIEMIREEEAQEFGAGYIPPSQDNPTGGFQQGNSSRTTNKKPQQSLRDQQLEIERQLKQSQSRSTGKMREYEPGSKPKNAAEAASAAMSKLSSQSKQPSRPTPPPPSASAPPAPLFREQNREEEEEEETWTCEICTLINPSPSLVCGACETQRPDPPLSSFPTGPKPSSSSTSRRPKQQPHNVLSSRSTGTAADTLARFEAAARQKAQSQPTGWKCGRCSNWMESQWWTCSVCGRMKESS